jgi:hypothetical protein
VAGDERSELPERRTLGAHFVRPQPPAAERWGLTSFVPSHPPPNAGGSLRSSPATRRDQWRNNRGERRDEIRNQVEENHPRLDFWTDHPRWAARRITRLYRWVTWAGIAGWVGYGWTDLYPYYYGENLYYADDSVWAFCSRLLWGVG